MPACTTQLFMNDLYIGLMSGTSLDGADGVLVDFSGQHVQVISAASQPFPSEVRAELLALNTPSHNELHRAALAGNQLAVAYAQVVEQLLEQALRQGVLRTQVVAIGAHGQTVRHQPMPDQLDAAYTIQLNNPARLAELTRMDVVADFRSRDVAAGGQGAPLVPAFHQSVFGSASNQVAVLNLGGIANLSVIAPTQLATTSTSVLGFDCGPGNALMDAWAHHHTGQMFDEGGAWAATGQLIAPLLAHFLNEPYFAKSPPKSTGRDLFSLAWLAEKLRPFADEKPQDIQHSLTEFTAKACAACVESYAKESKVLIVCGGGAFNQHLMERLQASLPWLVVQSSSEHGMPPLQVEAAAFAWLARQTIQRRPGNLASVTGAAGSRVLGAIYPA